MILSAKLIFLFIDSGLYEKNINFLDSWFTKRDLIMAQGRKYGAIINYSLCDCDYAFPVHNVRRTMVLAKAHMFHSLEPILIIWC